MPNYEFKVIPAPVKGKSARGVRGKPEKFAHALSLVMNEMGAKGWDYVRADTLPCEERQGLTHKVTTYHNMLVFRREIVPDVTLDEMTQKAEAAMAPASDPAPAPELAPASATTSAPAPNGDDGPPRDATRIHSALLTRGAQLANTPTDAPETDDEPAPAKPPEGQAPNGSFILPR